MTDITSDILSIIDRELASRKSYETLHGATDMDIIRLDFFGQAIKDKLRAFLDNLVGRLQLNILKEYRRRVEEIVDNWYNTPAKKMEGKITVEDIIELKDALKGLQ